MLTRKIDFALVILAQNCNPNGDPLNLNQPRQDIDGHGEMSDVCIKHKIRQRLSSMGENVLVLNSEDSAITSIKGRVDAETEIASLLKEKPPQVDLFKKSACEKWIDVRTFGQVFALRSVSKSFGVSTSLRGPMSIQMARTLEPVLVESVHITKSVNLDTNPDKPFLRDSSSMGILYLINRGVYVSYGSIFPSLSEQTGFSDDDAEKIKLAMSTLFADDASARRPSGSMAVTLYWWEHNNTVGIKSPIVVHRSLNIRPIDTWPYFDCAPETIPGVSLQILGDFV